MADYQQQGRQVVVDRLKRRITQYRTDHNNISTHLEATFPTVFEAEHKRTLSLKQRHIESKQKKNGNKKDKKDTISNMGVSFFWIILDVSFRVWIFWWI